MAGLPYDQLQKKQQQLIRKMVDGSVFVASTSAEPITSLTDADKLLKPLPGGYEDVGYVSDDGAQFSRDVETSDVTSWGSVEPTRTDITGDTTTLQIACQETRKATIGLYTGAPDQQWATPDPITGELSIEKPARPGTLYYRVLALGVDLTGAGELYVARFLPNARVTDYDDQNFQSSDDEPLTFPVTLTAFLDSTLGYSERWLFGGPGWFALLAQMGFPVPQPPPPPPAALGQIAAAPAVDGDGAALSDVTAVGPRRKTRAKNANREGTAA